MVERLKKVKKSVGNGPKQCRGCRTPAVAGPGAGAGAGAEDQAACSASAAAAEVDGPVCGSPGRPAPPVSRVKVEAEVTEALVGWR